MWNSTKMREKEVINTIKKPAWRRAIALAGLIVLTTLTASLLLPVRASVTITVPYSTMPVADIDLDGYPNTGAWSDALSTSIPLENGASAPYGTATLYIKHDGANVYYRIDGSIDVAWVSATGNHFWLGMVVSQTGTSHHSGSGWDGIFFGLWDGTDYSPAPTYPPTPIDTNGFSKPPAKDTTQNALGAMRYSGSAAPYSFTAEWKKPLNTGDTADITLVADGTTTYNFFVTTDSDGKGSAGGSIDHSKITNLNTMKLAPPTPPVVHDVAITGVKASPSTVGVGDTVTITVNASNQGTESETFDVTAYYNSTPIETKATTLAAGGSTTLTFSWNTTGVAIGTYTIKAVASTVPGETDTADNTLTDGTVTVQTSTVTVNASLAGRSAWPAYHHLDLAKVTTQTLYAEVANTGTTQVYVYVKFQIRDANTGTLVATVNTWSPILLSTSEETATISAAWTPTVGKYSVTAILYYSATSLSLDDPSWQQSSSTKTFSFRVVDSLLAASLSWENRLI